MRRLPIMMSSEQLTVFAVSAAVIGTVALIIKFYEKNTNALCQSKRKLNGKTVIVSGGTAGMGLEVAREFARRGARVIIACPFQQEGVQARKTIIEDTNNQNVIFKHLDFASLASVRAFAEDILKNEDRLDILMNNAGVLTPKDVFTEDGISFVMQVNYFGHFLLTMLLLPLLKKTGNPSEPSRIVNMSSAIHVVGTINFDKINTVGFYFRLRIYSNSKLAMAMFTKELYKRLSNCNVVVNTVDPGAVGTKLYDTFGKFAGTFVTILFGNLFKTPWEGAQTALHVALDDEAGRKSGEYFKNCKLSKAIWWAYNKKKCEQLWNESVKLVKLTNFDNYML